MSITIAYDSTNLIKKFKNEAWIKQKLNHISENWLYWLEHAFQILEQDKNKAKKFFINKLRIFDLMNFEPKPSIGWVNII